MCRFWHETVARTLHVAMVMIIDLVNLRACHVGVDVVVVVSVVCEEFRLRCVLPDLMWVHVAVDWFARRMFFKCACVCACVGVGVCLRVETLHGAEVSEQSV